SAGGWLLRILYLLVGLVAAAACLLKAGYAPVASLPQAGEIQAKLGGDNLAYIGLACAAWGVIWLLVGRIIYGLLPNLAVIAAGLYAASDFLAARSEERRVGKECRARGAQCPGGNSTDC